MRKKDNSYDIRGMNIPEETKLVLEKIENAAKINQGSFKKSIPSVFLEGDKGTGSSGFAQVYERILASNHVYMVRGSQTFLELVFPRNGTEKDYQRFFQSPKTVASIQNQFYGVFAISFEEWEGKELLESEQFKALLTFVDNNKDNIFFVFQITKDFKAKDELRRTLNNHINMVEAHLNYLDLDMSAEYIQNYLEKDGIRFSVNGKKELKRFLNRKLNMESQNFAGYHSLQQVARSIQFELLSEDLMDDKTMQVSDYMLRTIESRVIAPETVEVKSRTMGFSMN